MAEIVDPNEHRSFAVVSKTTGNVLRRLRCSIADAELQALPEDEELVQDSEEVLVESVSPARVQLALRREAETKRADDAKKLFTSGGREYFPNRQRMLEVAVVGGKLYSRPDGYVELTPEEGKVVLKDFLNRLDKLTEDRDAVFGRGTVGS